MLTTILAAMLPAAAAPLTIEITGLEHTGGSVMIALYDDAETLKSNGEPPHGAALPIESDTVSWSPEGVRPGTWMVAAFHHAKDN